MPCLSESVESAFVSARRTPQVRLTADVALDFSVRVLSLLFTATGVSAGPGDYDPSKAKGFKADPKSGFLTGDRFNDLEREGMDGSTSSSDELLRNITPVS